MRIRIAAVAAACGMAVLAPACSSSSKPAATSPTTTAAPTSTTIATTKKQSVFVLSVNPAQHTVTVDPMEFLTGSAATAAYHKANPHARPGGPDNDYYIVNPTKDHVVMTLDPNVTVRVVQANGTTNNPPVAVPLTKLISYPSLSLHPFWLTVERGKVTAIDEQFVP